MFSSGKKKSKVDLNVENVIEESINEESMVDSNSMSGVLAADALSSSRTKIK